jgi:hypothetical protein
MDAVADAHQDDPVDLRGLTLAETEALVMALGHQRFRGEQLWRWVHERGAASLDEMTNLAKQLREQLAPRVRLGSLTRAEMQTSHPVHLHAGRLRDGLRVLRLGRRGLKRTSPRARSSRRCSSGARCSTRARPSRNVVLMGMGEPLHNYDNGGGRCDSSRTATASTSRRAG